MPQQIYQIIKIIPANPIFFSGIPETGFNDAPQSLIKTKMAKVVRKHSGFSQYSTICPYYNGRLSISTSDIMLTTIGKLYVVPET